jgi:hypothetical protein
MFGSTILDVAIGLVFIYCLYSLFATTIKEIIASMIGLRAKMLEKAIKQMLDDPQLNKDLFEKFYKHPIIKYMNDGFKSRRKPSYISPSTFSKTLVDILIENNSSLLGTQAVSSKSITNGLKALSLKANKKTDPQQSSDTIRLLESFFIDSNKDILKFKALLEQWFNEMMDRATGWYKRQAQWIIFVIGLFIAVAFNASTFSITSHLMIDKGAREGFTQMASSYLLSHTKPQTNDSTSVTINSVQAGDSLVNNAVNLYKTDIKQSNQLLGLGWSGNAAENNMDYTHWFINILGWLVTAIAISLGAPFWFDLLSRLVQLRGTGPKTEEVQTTTASNEVPITKSKG